MSTKVILFLFLPLIILYIPIEFDFFVPTGFAEVLADLFLNSWRNEALAVAKLIVIGATMFGKQSRSNLEYI